MSKKIKPEKPAFQKLSEAVALKVLENQGQHKAYRYFDDDSVYLSSWCEEKYGFIDQTLEVQALEVFSLEDMEFVKFEHPGDKGVVLWASVAE